MPDGAASPPPKIHPSAVVGPDVQLSPGVEIGPLCLVDGAIRIGARTRLIGHVTILGITEFGEDNVLHPGAVIGDEPQDLSYRGAPRAVKIGNRNVFREYATVHRGSEHGAITIMGDDNYMMQNSHVAHDCRIGNSTIIAGGALLAGWVELGDRALVSGNCVVHQYTRIGRLAMMRGLSRTSRDVPPFCIMDGTHTLRSINIVGLKRAGISNQAIHALRHAFGVLFGTRQNLKLAIARLLEAGNLAPEVIELIDFIRASKRGVAFGPHHDGSGGDGED
ncbi:MAG: acyl-ACP--UDP-N-acetylglucosamine O-acyltransferase [Candidatus Binatus sp.]|uniref:acyl-ACP--UDP-N-acetylglucosamine O-acyltransferase n=1 Tax=Candidatus Binatus sp. TaxID=2811406 RepID=UPI002723CDE5|nr:acyl-ACP--UDP-N-acetylglucosamine O-acyltransferase [Candidatus Binatus sp.]MDO8433757.1 acyl-ACP--UDP-N-acetylglucosamine O-acyltransferase [Candidatus Binatus sp.]